MESKLSAKLARSQQSLQHVIIIIIERMFALIYLLYSGRPGYVTCCGIIGSAMFWIGGYLLASPPPNILSDINDENDINIYYLASNILPFQTFIHIALLFLASITYWKIQNILSFCMVKCGCFYLFVHAMFSFVLVVKYLYLNFDNINYDMMVLPLTFIGWFLFPSMFGFLIVGKQHSINDELQYKWKQIKIKNRNENSKKYQQLSCDIDDEQLLYDEQFINQQYWCYYIYIALALNVAWYITYSFLQCLHNLYLIDKGLDCEILSTGQWISGYTQSFTMSFHRAFIMSCIYNIIFRPWCHNTVYIAIGATLTSLLLNAAYLSIFLNQSLLSISFVLILSKNLILSFLLFCEYKLSQLLALKTEYNIHEMVRKRPSMFDILLFKGDITRQQKKALYIIIISSTLFFIGMQLEVVFMLLTSTYLFQTDQNPWMIFNKLLLWSFHLCTIYVHAMVVSVQFNDSYIRASRLLASLNVSLLIFAICNLVYVSYSIWSKPQTKYIYLDYIVIMFCLIRSLTALSAWIGFSKLKTIEPFSMPTYNYDDITQHEKKLSMSYVKLYAILLFCYYVACLYRYEWNGNLFLLNQCNWSIICSETPIYGLLFHSGLLNIIFIFDAGISKRWAPTWDLSRLFLLSITILGCIQIVNCLILYCGNIYSYNKCEIALLIALIIWMAVSLKMCIKLHTLDNLFLYKRKLFV